MSGEYDRRSRPPKWQIGKYAKPGPIDSTAKKGTTGWEGQKPKKKKRIAKALKAKDERMVSKAEEKKAHKAMECAKARSGGSTR